MKKSLLTKCSFPGCKNEHRGKGYCTGHLMQMSEKRPLTPLRHYRRKGSLPLIAFQETACPFPKLLDGPCHLWAHGKSKGYSITTLEGKQVRVRRLLWEQTNGPIPKRFFLKSLCGNKACINVMHQAIAPVKKTHCSHGHRFDRQNTYLRPDGNRECRECRKRRR